MREKTVEMKQNQAVPAGILMRHVKKSGAISRFFAVLRVDCMGTYAIIYARKNCEQQFFFYTSPELKTLPGILTIKKGRKNT